MIILHIAKTAGEWREACLERDGGLCRAIQHHKDCRMRAERVHHIVYKAHLSENALWVVENGISLSDACHGLAHATHNGSLDLTRCNAAVDAVNCIERYPVPRFKKERKAS